MANPAIPQPAMARPNAPPRHSIHRDANLSAIRIEQWTVEAVKKPIMSIKEIEAAEKKLNLPLPEMTFGNNALTLTYIPGSSSGSSSSSSSSSLISQAPHQAEIEAGATGKPDAGAVTITFNAIDALGEVSTGEGWEEKVGGGVRVSMADKWGKQRAEPSLLTDVPLPSKPVKPHDWTYSTTHAGSIAGPSRFVPINSPLHEIPIALLSRQDPVLDKILFYEDVPLFEDELHDNGESILNARIRVMPHSWFILARLFVRVDNVLFRMYDVRLYHAFGSGEIIRETSGMEADYDQVKAMLEQRTDLSPLTDANWVSRTMSTINSRLPPAERDSGCEKGREGGKAWPGLGKRIEVMRLPVTAESGEGLSRSMAGMGV